MVTTALSDKNADLEELQAIFDRAAPKRYDRADTDQKDRLGFLAEDLQHGGVTGKTKWGGRSFSRWITAVCKRLQARVEALENKRQG